MNVKNNIGYLKQNYSLHKILDKTGINNLSRYILSRKLKVIMYHGIIDDNIDIECWWLIKQSKFIRQIKFKMIY